MNTLALVLADVIDHHGGIAAAALALRIGKKRIMRALAGDLPLHTVAAVEVRTAVDAVCVVPYCGQRVVRAKFGPKRAPEYAGKCTGCVNALRTAAEKRARPRRHGVAA